MTPFTTVFQYCRVLASPERGGTGGSTISYFNIAKTSASKLRYIPSGDVSCSNDESEEEEQMFKSASLSSLTESECRYRGEETESRYRG